MTTFTFDRNYHNLDQVQPFMAAYMARFRELEATGEYPYNDLFRGFLGIDEGDEDTAIYLCQSVRHRDEMASRVAAALADGYVPVEGQVESPIKCSAVIHYGWTDHGSGGWQKWADVRLVPGLTDLPAVMPKRARTRGYNLLGGKLLAKFAEGR